MWTMECGGLRLSESRHMGAIRTLNTFFWIQYFVWKAFFGKLLSKESGKKKKNRICVHLFMYSRKEYSYWVLFMGKPEQYNLAHQAHYLFINKKISWLDTCQERFTFPKILSLVIFLYLIYYPWCWKDIKALELDTDHWWLNSGERNLSLSIHWNIFRKNIILWGGFIVPYFYCIIKSICVLL